MSGATRFYFGRLTKARARVSATMAALTGAVAVGVITTVHQQMGVHGSHVASAVGIGGIS